jgi:hypothetical protein
MGSPFPGPTPPYNNPPIEPQYFQPSQFYISSITLGINTTITTIKNHNYVIGQAIKLIIPPANGCRQLNEVTGYVILIPTANSVTTTINSSMNVDQFVSSFSFNQPQILAVGDVNTGIISSTGATIRRIAISGAFVNISPL